MSERALSYAVPVAIELVGIFFLAIGITVEIITRAEIGHLLISVGSAFIAVGSILWAKIFRIKRNEAS